MKGQWSSPFFHILFVLGWLERGKQACFEPVVFGADEKCPMDNWPSTCRPVDLSRRKSVALHVMFRVVTNMMYRKPRRMTLENSELTSELADYCSAIVNSNVAHAYFNLTLAYRDWHAVAQIVSQRLTTLEQALDWMNGEDPLLTPFRA